MMKPIKAKADPMMCTAPELARMLKLPKIRIPHSLYYALRNGLKQGSVFYSNECDDYTKCIKSLSNVKKIGEQDYINILRICLYLEQFELDLEMKRIESPNYEVKKSNLHECFIITMPCLNGDGTIIKPNDDVSLYDIVTRRTIWAKVVEVVGNDVTINVYYPQDVTRFEDKKFKIKIWSKHWPLRCCHYALKVMSNHNWTEIIYPQLRTYSTDIEFDIEWINTNIEKNEQQKQAVRKILNNTAHPAPYIIFGPPGTGKTATLVETINQIVRQFPTKNILVCTVSNSAADEITKRLLATKNIPANMIYRMYAPSRDWATVDEKIQPCANFVDKTTLFLSKELLLLKKIIITTLVSSVRLIGINFRENHFSYIIIDEASQATEPEILIPLTVTNKKTEDKRTRFQAQIVIAGDPYQLGPIVRCKEIEHLLGRSMLERLMNDCDLYKRHNGKYNPNYITKLIKNYRSHENLLYVSNKQFYKKELEIFGGADTKMALNWSRLPNKNFPMIFQEVLGQEERSATKSVYNTAEVLVVMAYVNMLITTKFGKRTITPKDIGIITPFKRQQLDIIQHLTAMNLRGITVGTVESFQGQERNVIILSTVRSKIFEHHNKEHIGFLSNEKRFNVALTRAKALMIIIGNPRILCQNKHWEVLWKYCKKNNGYILFDQCPLKKNLISNFKSIYNDNLVKNSDESNSTKLSITVNFGKEIKTLSDVPVYKMENLKI
ncbi:hypothetical protein P5V15_005285 [Pogonomyrmex californicus]